MNESRLFADSMGVWRENDPGQRYGIEWSEICQVGAYRLDENCIVVDLDFDFGHHIELMDDLPGFDDVVKAISDTLDGIDAAWIGRVRALKPDEDPIVVWKRL